MRFIFLTFSFAIFIVGSSFSQQPIDYNKIILPDNATNVAFDERLVQLAWRNNPMSHSAGELVNQFKEESKVVANNWTNTVGVSGNLNEFNVKNLTGNNDNGNLFFPRYNFYVQLPLSLIAQTPHAKKAARHKVAIAEDEVKLLKLELRAKVLKLYSDYKAYELVLNIRKQTMADGESNYLLVEQKFKNGDASVEEYLKMQNNRNEWKIQVAVAENLFVKSKLDLEEIIGMKIEDVR